MDSIPLSHLNIMEKNTRWRKHKIQEVTVFSKPAMQNDISICLRIVIVHAENLWGEFAISPIFIWDSECETWWTDRQNCDCSHVRIAGTKMSINNIEYLFLIRGGMALNNIWNLTSIPGKQYGPHKNNIWVGVRPETSSDPWIWPGFRKRIM